MKCVLDMHTHSIASGHAYSTINEMIQYAKSINLLMLGITEHAISMPGTCHMSYFQNIHVVPRQSDNLKIMMGSELNIIDYKGNVDLPESVIEKLDYTIASLHGACIEPGDITQNTNAILGAIKNKYVKIIGHPDESIYCMDYDVICSAASEHKTLLEVNNASLSTNSFRKGARENYTKMLELCKKYRTHIALGTDAHIMYDIGDFSNAQALLKEVDFPEELVVNTSVDKFLSFI